MNADLKSPTTYLEEFKEKKNRAVKDRQFEMAASIRDREKDVLEQMKQLEESDKTK